MSSLRLAARKGRDVSEASVSKATAGIVPNGLGEKSRHASKWKKRYNVGEVSSSSGSDERGESSWRYLYEGPRSHVILASLSEGIRVWTFWQGLVVWDEVTIDHILCVSSTNLCCVGGSTHLEVLEIGELALLGWQPNLLYRPYEPILARLEEEGDGNAVLLPAVDDAVIRRLVLVRSESVEDVSNVDDECSW